MHTQHGQIDKQESSDATDHVSNMMSLDNGMETANPSSTRRLIRTVHYYSDGTMVVRNNNNHKSANNSQTNCGATNCPDQNKDILGTTEEMALLSFADDNAPIHSSLLQQRQQQAADAAQGGSALSMRLGDPAPAALYAFSCTTMLYCAHVVTGAKMDSDIMGMVLFYGGLTQFLCGVIECFRGNTLPFTIFTAFGAFWLSIAAGNSIFSTDFAAAESRFSAGHSIIWGCLSIALLAASLRAPIATIVTVSLLCLFFIMLAIATYANSPTMVKATGAEGVLLGMAAFYGATAHLLETVYGRHVLPQGVNHRMSPRK